MSSIELVRDTSYVLLFDVSRQGYQTWRGALLPAIVAIAGSVLALISSRRSSNRDARGQVVLYSRVVAILAGFGIVGAACILFYTWHEYQDLRGVIQARNYRTTIGIITDIVAEGPDGHPRESFRVGDVVFQYSSSDITSAFHHTVGSGGPLRNGLAVRVADFNGRIVRLEAFTTR